MLADHLQMISLADVVRVHEAALRLLRDTGIVIQHAETRKRLAEAGALVDDERQLVRFPERVTLRLIGLAPAAYTLGARDPARDLQLTLYSGLTRPIAGCNHILDSQTKRRRDPTLGDMQCAARLTDALDNIDINAALIYGVDEPPPTRAVHYFSVLLDNTTKHICMSPYGPRDVHYMIEMALAVCGSREALAERPLFNIITSSASPLVYSEHYAAAIALAAEWGIPSMMGSTPVLGGTGPVTLAGALALMHAENLAGVMIAQAARPGAPVYLSARPPAMDMRSGVTLWGPIEWPVISAAAAQLARLCGLPIDLMGPMTDSKLPDQQAGIERGINTLMAGLAGCAILAGAGCLDTIATASLEQLAIDDDLIGAVRRALRGIRVDDEALALDLIQQVGPGGNYLMTQHTRRLHRSEHFTPALADRATYGKWEEAGGRDLVDRAAERAGMLLDRHQVPPLAESVRRDVQGVMAAARRELLEVKP